MFMGTCTARGTGGYPPPGDPDLSQLLVKCIDENGAPEQGVEVHARMTEGANQNVAGDATTQTVLSDISGVAQLTLVRNATYQYRRGDAATWTEIIGGATDQTTVPPIVGAP